VARPETASIHQETQGGPAVAIGGNNTGTASAVGTINAQPGSAVSVGQQGGITVGQIFVDTAYPGFGMIHKQRIAYTGEPMVYLSSGQRLDAKTKLAGTLYIAVFISDVTHYNIRENESRIRMAITTLSAQDGVRVFFTPNPGGYTLIKNDLAVILGSNLSLADKPVGVYYFSRSLEEKAGRIRNVVSGLGTEAAFQFRPIPPGGGDEERLIYTDIFKASGIDIEVVL
jgi:hypothetical protein